ncbi:MAG: D-2-hydroxyacid dehydrogenase [Tissierellia bacterium]|nr:D-2-hydroxyacid dehydrogenase [Tissierellia bacterium]
MFLKVADVEAAFPAIVGEGEEWKIYSSLNDMLPEKEKIEIILNAGLEGAGLGGATVLGEFPNLRWVFNYFAGVDHYPMEMLREKGVILTNVSGVHGKNIAEQVTGAMIMFTRCYLTTMKNQQKKIYDRNLPLAELCGKKLLIVGAGAIGREIARKAKAFDMVVTGIRNRAVAEIPENFDEMYTTDVLDEHLADQDFIVSVLPSTEKTQGLFNGEKFKLMSPDAVFMNVGRGDLIVVEDLVEALNSGEIKGAYLDVFPEEPLPEDSPLWDLENLIITPHIAGTTPNYFPRAMEIFKENFSRYKNGKELMNVVDYNLKY